MEKMEIDKVLTLKKSIDIVLRCESDDLNTLKLNYDAAISMLRELLTVNLNDNFEEIDCSKLCYTLKDESNLILNSLGTKQSLNEYLSHILFYLTVILDCHRGQEVNKVFELFMKSISNFLKLNGNVDVIDSIFEDFHKYLCKIFDAVSTDVIKCQIIAYFFRSLDIEFQTSNLSLERMEAMEKQVKSISSKIPNHLSKKIAVLFIDKALNLLNNFQNEAAVVFLLGSICILDNIDEDSTILASKSYRILGLAFLVTDDQNNFEKISSIAETSENMHHHPENKCIELMNIFKSNCYEENVFRSYLKEIIDEIKIISPIFLQYLLKFSESINVCNSEIQNAIMNTICNAEDNEIPTSLVKVCINTLIRRFASSTECIESMTSLLYKIKSLKLDAECQVSICSVEQSIEKYLLEGKYMESFKLISTLIKLELGVNSSYRLCLGCYCLLMMKKKTDFKSWIQQAEMKKECSIFVKYLHFKNQLIDGISQDIFAIIDDIANLEQNVEEEKIWLLILMELKSSKYTILSLKIIKYTLENHLDNLTICAIDFILIYFNLFLQNYEILNEKEIVLETTAILKIGINLLKKYYKILDEEESRRVLLFFIKTACSLLKKHHDSGNGLTYYSTCLELMTFCDEKNDVMNVWKKVCLMSIASACLSEARCHLSSSLPSSNIDLATIAMDSINQCKSLVEGSKPESEINDSALILKIYQLEAMIFLSVGTFEEELNKALEDFGASKEACLLLATLVERYGLKNSTINCLKQFLSIADKEMHGNIVDVSLLKGVSLKITSLLMHSNRIDTVPLVHRIVEFIKDNKDLVTASEKLWTMIKVWNCGIFYLSLDNESTEGKELCLLAARILDEIGELGNLYRTTIKSHIKSITKSSQIPLIRKDTSF